MVRAGRVVQSHLGACSGQAAVHRPLIVEGYRSDGDVHGILFFCGFFP